MPRIRHGAPAFGKARRPYRSRKNDGYAILMGCLMIILLFSYSVSHMTTPYSERGAHDKNGATGANGTIPPLLGNTTEPKEVPHPACDDTNWSAGSAFFTIVALCFGYYSHPRGSLTAARSGRTWRLSPILALQETIVMAGLLFYPRMKGRSFSTTCYAIMASRLANGFHPGELQEVLGLTMEPPPRHDDLEAYRMAKEANSRGCTIAVPDSRSRNTARNDSAAEDAGAEMQEFRNEPSAMVESGSLPAEGVEGVTASRGALTGASVDLEMNELPHNSPAAVAAGTEGPESTLLGSSLDWRAQMANHETAKAIVAQHRLEYNVHLFKGLFRYIRAMDAGPSYRIFVWLPMLLQVFKLGTVLWLSERVSRLTYLIASTYFLSWLAVEMVMITTAHNDLSDDEAETAALLAHDWTKPLTWFSAEERLDGGQGVSALLVPSLSVVTVVNIVLTGKFAFGGGLPYISNTLVAVLVFACICVATLVVFYCCTLPLSLMLVQGLVALVWKGSRAEKRFGTPRMLREPVEDPSLYAASAALHGAVLAFLTFKGVGPWKDFFPCWTMKQPSFYGWLG